LRAGRDARSLPGERLPEGAPLSSLRAKCPDCLTYTAVALGPDYECHACGRSFAAGLVRVPPAWGAGGGLMEEAARPPPPPPAPLSRGARRGRGDAARAEPLARVRPPRPAARPRRLLLLARRRDRGPRGAPRTYRGRLARRARRPQHTGDLAVRERVGHAAPD